MEETYTIGKYRLQRAISRGKSGDVWLSHDPNLDVPVAIKILYPGDGSLGSVARFQREAATAATVTHPNVVRVFTCDADRETHFIVMEYLSGGTAKDLLAMPYSEEQVARVKEVIIEVARGLQALHRKGIIHRDVKPSNILMTEDGTAKVADLGIGKRFDEVENGLTTTGNMIGTPYYLAPERALDPERVDQRSDLYALGCTWYHLVTGCVPFDGDGAMQVIIKHLHDKRPDPQEFNPHLPAADAAAIRKLMAREPHDRYQDVGDLLNGILGPEPTPEVVESARHSAAYYGRLSALMAVLVLVIGGMLTLRSTNDLPTEANSSMMAPTVTRTTPVRWVEVKSGKFLMGSDAALDSLVGPAALPRHEVAIATAFAVADAPVTRAQYAEFCREATVAAAVLGAGFDELQQPSPGTELLPVTAVSWDAAMAYCQWLTVTHQAAGKLPSSSEYRLPTEAEWEYMARAGTETPYWFGSDAVELRRFGNSGGTALLPVRSFPANPWGIHDVHGNVWEWCLDGPRSYQSISELDPLGPIDENRRTLRGGAWNAPAETARVAARAVAPRDASRDNVGFRIVRAPTSQFLAVNTN